MSDDHMVRLLGAALDYRAAYHGLLATYAEEYKPLDPSRRERIEHARDRLTTAKDALFAAALALEEGDRLVASLRLPSTGHVPHSGLLLGSRA